VELNQSKSKIIVCYVDDDHVYTTSNYFYLHWYMLQ